MCKTMLIVVLYDKTYKDSLTLNCLMSKEYREVDLLIVNVGPYSLTFDKEFIHTLGFFVGEIYIKEVLDGRPLDEVYNAIINEGQDYDRFVFMDGDCKLHKNYLNLLDTNYAIGVDLQIPHISGVNNSGIHYPLIDDVVQKSNDVFIIDQRNSVKTIGVGLVIYRELIDKFGFAQMDVFGRNFNQHDIDSDFFDRIVALRIKAVNITIQVVGVVGHFLPQRDDTFDKWDSAKRIYNRVFGIKPSF